MESGTHTYIKLFNCFNWNRNTFWHDNVNHTVAEHIIVSSDVNEYEPEHMPLEYDSHNMQLPRLWVYLILNCFMFNVNGVKHWIIWKMDGKKKDPHKHTSKR